jgi:hypothetical protein
MDITQLKNQMAELQKQISTFGKEALAEKFKDFFEKHPQVEAVEWTQYTPYFNDGDVCEFRRNEFGYVLTPGTKYTDWDNKLQVFEKGDEPIEGYYVRKGALGVVIENLETSLEGIDDIFEATFGDGVKVAATKDGFDVESYDHD